MGSAAAFILGSLSTLSVSAPLYAQVPKDLHTLCLPAKDYQGCIRAQQGIPNEPTRSVIDQGAGLASGNSCPAGYAYVGMGNCQYVTCIYPSTDLGHDQLVAGKSKWGCKYNWLRGAGELRLGGATLRAGNNPECPPGEPMIGWNNTCETSGKGIDLSSPPITEPPRGNTLRRPTEL
ncbi:hypothetical protein Cyagr_1315 [Cyanobium gracile PCC 6307]|uniref:Secreted protein n=1 Tax=Cyanobium gracile (strain ATCC 27147 / PCC 6307) TaxID=292564 RepID=K9P6Z0_CYAGP|nr:hypothetical protein Cyagr_1315 [Cyanobium gracile PCC 6307]